MATAVPLPWAEDSRFSVPVLADACRIHDEYFTAEFAYHRTVACWPQELHTTVQMHVASLMCTDNNAV